MEMIKEVLSRNLRSIRRERGWTQDDLAEKAGYSTSFVADIERGKSWVSPESIERICDALEVSCDRLFSTDRPGRMFDMPMSKAIKKLLAIPDEVYNRAQEFHPDHEVWGAVIATMNAYRIIEEKKLAAKEKKA
jgi:transcriptional regulator with XRE-family HTH domain